MHQALKPMAAAVFKPVVKHSGPSVCSFFRIEQSGPTIFSAQRSKPSPFIQAPVTSTEGAVCRLTMDANANISKYIGMPASFEVPP
jgi:hypothetical protein